MIRFERKREVTDVRILHKKVEKWKGRGKEGRNLPVAVLSYNWQTDFMQSYFFFLNLDDGIGWNALVMNIDNVFKK